MENCLFCDIANGIHECTKVHETPNSLAFFGRYPANKYHTIVITKKHYADLFDVPLDELQEMMASIKYIIGIYREKLGITDIQLINSSGIDAQQSVPHIHFHIVPRFSKDGQDIKWQTKPELHEHFEQLLAALKDG